VAQEIRLKPGIQRAASSCHMAGEAPWAWPAHNAQRVVIYRIIWIDPWLSGVERTDENAPCGYLSL